MTDNYTDDTWLADKIDKSAGRITLTKDISAQDLAHIPADLEFCYAKIPLADIASADALACAGFQYINAQALLQKGQAAPFTDNYPQIRPSVPEDKVQVWDIAFNAYSFDRFHVDKKLAHKADLINASWATNFYSGNRGTDMFVWDDNGTIAGFLLLIVEEGHFSIDLIAVDKKYMRLGIAQKMISHAEKFFSDCTTFSVVTQMENTPAIQLYSRLGYRIGEIDGLFHRHV